MLKSANLKSLLVPKIAEVSVLSLRCLGIMMNDDITKWIGQIKIII